MASTATKFALNAAKFESVVLVPGIHRGVIPALEFAKSLAPDNTTALYVDLDPEAAAKVRAKWDYWGGDVPLEILPSPYRSLVGPILRYIDELDARRFRMFITVSYRSPRLSAPGQPRRGLREQGCELIRVTQQFVTCNCSQPRSGRSQ